MEDYESKVIKAVLALIAFNFAIADEIKYNKKVNYIIEQVKDYESKLEKRIALEKFKNEKRNLGYMCLNHSICIKQINPYEFVKGYSKKFEKEMESRKYHFLIDDVSSNYRG